MQSLQKSLNQGTFNQSIFKKKQLKKKISEYLHICQCGRQFLSFPAIYSHAKTKHNFKISSRIGDEGRKIVEKNSRIKIYYQINYSALLQQKSSSLSEQNKNLTQPRLKQNSSKFNFINKIRKLQTKNNRKNIYASMVEFLNESTKQFTLDAINFTAQILDQLTTCINEHYMHFDNSKVQRNYCEENTCETVPCYFNFFLLWYLPSKEKEINQNSSKVEALLKILFKWLRANQYTFLDEQSLREQKAQTQWKSYFIKIKDSTNDQISQKITKKQVNLDQVKKVEQE